VTLCTVRGLVYRLQKHTAIVTYNLVDLLYIIVHHVFDTNTTNICIERARNISAKANFSAISNYRQVSCDGPFEGINPSTAQF
jgi:hypothetical protein